MSWKELKNKPEDDKNYLIWYLKADGTYSLPHKAWFSEEEQQFFSLESFHTHPLVCDIFMELPKASK